MYDFVGEFLKRIEREDNEKVAMVVNTPHPKKPVWREVPPLCPFCRRLLNEKGNCDNNECVPF